MPRAKLKKKNKRILPKKPAAKPKKIKAKKKVFKAAAKKRRPAKKIVAKRAKKIARKFKITTPIVIEPPKPEKKTTGEKKVFPVTETKAVKIKTAAPAIRKTPAPAKVPAPTQVAALPEKIFVAPVTPFIPAGLIVKPSVSIVPRKNPSVQLSEKPASGHLVDLRAMIDRQEAKAVKKERQNNFVEIPRTISSHRRAKFSWETSLPVAFGKFTVALCREIVVGAGKVAALPVTVALKLADKIDFDRRKDIGAPAKIETPEEPPLKIFEKETEPETEAPAPLRRPFNFQRAILSFAGMSLAVVLPLEGMNLYRSLNEVKDKAEAAGTKGIALVNAAQEGVIPDPADIETARAAFTDAGLAVAKVGIFGNALVDWLPVVGEKYRSGKELVAAGDALLSAAASLHDFTDALASSDDVIGKIERLERAALATEPDLAKAVSSLLNVKSVPAQFSEDDFLRNLSLLASADVSLRSFIDVAPSIYKILGRETSRRYLVVFQNNAEIRPTGGFMGSFALVDVDRGRITKIEVPAGGPYDLQGSLKASVIAPDPLKLVNSRWQFQDANWFPDFSASAQKIIWFYSKAGGPTVDGVVALNAPILAKLVDAVGPINMPEYGKVVVGSTVLQTTQEIVESDAARESGKPKQFIADLLPKVLDKVLTGDRETTLRAVSIFADSLANKDIQLYMRDQEVQEKMSALGWTGTIAPLAPATDSFELVRANIAGQKTDSVITTAIDHRSSIADDGTITDTVKITLTHNGKKGEPFTGVRNVEYLRAYVPPGSVLIEASGDIRQPDYKLFDAPPAGTVPDEMLSTVTGAIVHDRATGTAVNNEFGRTVFGAWTQTDPGKSSTIVFTYNLPWKAVPEKIVAPFSSKILMTATATPSYEHAIIFSRQAGAGPTAVTASLSLPLSWYPEYAYPEGIAASNGYQTSFSLDSDRRLSVKAVAP